MTLPRIAREGGHPQFATEQTADCHWRGHPMRFARVRWSLIYGNRLLFPLTPWNDNR